MPELPEVEACRRLAARHCTGKLIQTAQVANDDKVIDGIEPAKLQAALQGRTVKEAHRKGKHMWLEFDSGPCLMLHFGMTGSLVVKGVKSHQYKSFKVDDTDWPPKHWKLLLDLEGDVSIAFSDSRRFARVRLQADPANHEPVSLLGFDPLLTMPPLEDFSTAIKLQKRTLKALLLDQAFSAGIGNWVADEVLYQAKLYPEVKANSLTDAEIKQLHEAIKYVPETAVEAEADHEKFPPDWLFHVRWDGKKKSPKLNGQAVEFLKVGGRTTAYVPAVQKAAADTIASQAKGRAKGKRKAESDAKTDEDERNNEEEDDDDEEEAKQQEEALSSPAKAAKGGSKQKHAGGKAAAGSGKGQNKACNGEAAPKRTAKAAAEEVEQEKGDPGDKAAGAMQGAPKAESALKGKAKARQPAPKGKAKAGVAAQEEKEEGAITKAAVAGKGKRKCKAPKGGQ